MAAGLRRGDLRGDAFDGRGELLGRGGDRFDIGRRVRRRPGCGVGEACVRFRLRAQRDGGGAQLFRRHRDVANDGADARFESVGACDARGVSRRFSVRLQAFALVDDAPILRQRIAVPPDRLRHRAEFRPLPAIGNIAVVIAGLQPPHPLRQRGDRPSDRAQDEQRRSGRDQNHDGADRAEIGQIFGELRVEIIDENARGDEGVPRFEGLDVIDLRDRRVGSGTRPEMRHYAAARPRAGDQLTDHIGPVRILQIDEILTQQLRQDRLDDVHAVQVVSEEIIVIAIAQFFDRQPIGGDRVLHTAAGVHGLLMDGRRERMGDFDHGFDLNDALFIAKVFDVGERCGQQRQLADQRHADQNAETRRYVELVHRTLRAQGTAKTLMR